MRNIEALGTPLFSLFLGACVGSFLNVCLYRWKNGGQVFFPASFCPRCKKSIFWFDNVPVLSFFILGGKCRFCHRPISFQYPFVEMFTATLFFINSEIYSKNSFLLIFGFLFMAFLVLFIFSDIRWRLLPHLFNNFFSLLGLIFVFIQSPVIGSKQFSAVCSFVVMTSILFILVQIFPNGFGGGDIKMVSGLAIWLGFFKTLCVLFFACVTALAFILGLLCVKKVSWKWMIPFGPFLACGALVFWFFPDLAVALEKSLLPN